MCDTRNFKLCRGDRYKAESLARFAATCLVGVGLSVSTFCIPSVVPPSSCYLIGLWSVLIGTGFPKLLFALLGGMPPLLLVTLLAVVCAMALLACAWISTGVLVTVYAVYVLLMASLFFGPRRTRTSGYPAVLCVVPGMLVVSFYPLLPGNDERVELDIGTAFGTILWPELIHMLIATSWAILAVATAALLPPFRTARSLLTRDSLPPILRSIEACTRHDTKTAHEAVVRRQIQHAIVSGIHQKASLTVFEPRLGHCRKENLVPPLARLLDEVELLARYALLKHADSVTGGESYPPTLALLSRTARALETGNPAELMAQDDPQEEDLEEHKEKDSSYLTQVVYQHAQRVRDATFVWLIDLHSPTGNGSSGKTNCLLILLQPLVPVQRLLVEIPRLLLHPKQWNGRALLWTVEYASGYVLLLALSLYLPSYRFLGMGGSTDDSVYTGWQLLAYAFSWTPTVEGTVKRGLSRVLGTILGGLCAWVGLFLTGLNATSNNEEETTLHPVAVTVWIVYWCVLVAGLATETGPSALMGCGPDLGAVAKYFGATLALCALEVYAGVGPRNAVVANRVVATLTGVVLALVVQGLPPHTRVRDLALLEDYRAALHEALARALDAMLNAEDDSGNTNPSATSKLQEAATLGQRARFLAKDAAALSGLPFLRIDSRIPLLLESMYVTESLVGALVEVENEDRSAVARDYRALLKPLLEECLAAIQTASTKTEEGIPTPPHPAVVPADDSRSAVVSAAHLCVKRMHSAGGIRRNLPRPGGRFQFFEWLLPSLVDILVGSLERKSMGLALVDGKPGSGDCNRGRCPVPAPHFLMGDDPARMHRGRFDDEPVRFGPTIYKSIAIPREHSWPLRVFGYH